MIGGIITTELLLFAIAVFILAGTVKGALGIGLPTISISILAQFVDPRIAIALLLVPALFTNTWQVYRGGRVKRSVTLLWPFVLSMCVVMFSVSLLAARASTEALTGGIGIMVVLWAVTSFISKPPKIPQHLRRPAQCILGGISGLMGGLTAIWSPPLIIYLLSIRCDKDDFVRLTGLILLCGAIPLTIGYVLNGLLNKQLAMASCLMIIPTLLGFSLGEVIRKHMSIEQFHKAVLVLFVLMGLNLIRRAFFV